MTNDIVSIIIPIYNVAPFVDECIRSVSTQTYLYTEIILVDDGSTDESAAICDAWREKDCRIKVIHKENGGLSDARNAGLDIATGKYVLFVDGDDSIDPHLLETVLPHMEIGVDAVSFGYRLVYPNEHKQQIVFNPNVFEKDREIFTRDFIYGKFFRHQIPWSVWSHLYSHQFIKKYQLHFVDTQKIVAEDLLFNLCCYAHINKAVNIDACLYNYRLRSGSLMDNNNSNKKTNIDRKNNLSKELLRHFRQWPDCAHFLEHFPILHYLIVERNLQEARQRFSSSLRAFRNAILTEARESDIDYFTQQLHDFDKAKKDLKRTYSSLQIAEKASCCRFLLTGHSFLYPILSTAKLLRDKRNRQRTKH